MALALMSIGEKRTVIKVRGKDEVIRHLMDLGFAPGTEVLVVGENVAESVLLWTEGWQIRLWWPDRVGRKGE